MESRSRPIGELVNRSSFPRPRGVPRAPQSAYVQDSHLPVNNQPLAAITSETYPTYFRWIAKLTRVHRITVLQYLLAASLRLELDEFYLFYPVNKRDTLCLDRLGVSIGIKRNH